MFPARIAGVYGPTGFDICASVVARLAVMVGGIIIAVVLLLLFPVAIILSGGVLAAMIASMMTNSVDNNYVGTEALELSRLNPYN